MEACTITLNLKIVPGTRADYESLSHYHYRESHLGPCAAIFVLKSKFRSVLPPSTQSAQSKNKYKYISAVSAVKFNDEKRQIVSAGHLTVGVIVYSMPTAGAQMRNIATGGIFAELDRTTQLKLINKNIRTISRVIIEPRFRSLGLAVRLVRETMPLMNVPFVEALAVMGRANPFFEKVGLTRYDANPQAGLGAKRLIEAFSAVGIDEQDLIDAELVQEKLEAIFTAETAENAEKKEVKNNLRGLGVKYTFIESEMARFLQSYGRRRLMQPGIERTRFVLNKLTDRPVYYMWKNPNIELRT